LRWWMKWAAPTAKRMPNALAQRRASSIQVSSRRHSADPSATVINSGMPTPTTAALRLPVELPEIIRCNQGHSRVVDLGENSDRFHEPRPGDAYGNLLDHHIAE